MGIGLPHQAILGSEEDVWSQFLSLDPRYLDYGVGGFFALTELLIECCVIRRAVRERENSTLLDELLINKVCGWSMEEVEAGGSERSYRPGAIVFNQQGGRASRGVMSELVLGFE
jgi:hypothetical protein